MKRNLLAVMGFSMLVLAGSASKMSAQTRANAPAITQSLRDDPLASDPRLTRKIDFTCSEINLRDIFVELRTYTKARIVTQEGWHKLSIHVTNTSIHDLLDSIGAICHCVWKREGDKWTLSTPDNPLYLDACRPHTPEQAEMTAQGVSLIADTDKLPPDLKQRLLDMSVEAKGLHFAELTPEMQELTKTMYRMDRQEHLSDVIKGGSTWPETLTDCRVRLTHRDLDGGVAVQSLDISIDNPNAEYQRLEVGPSFFTLPGSKPDYHVVPATQMAQSASGRAADAYEEFKKSREMALAEDKRLNQPITLTIEKTTFLSLLQTLTHFVNIPFVSSAPSLNSDRHTFRFNKTPLRDVLDQIAAAYQIRMSIYGQLLPGNAPEPISPYRSASTSTTVNGKVFVPKPFRPSIYAWGQRKSGIFMFRIVPAQDIDDYTAKQKTAKVKLPLSSKPLPLSK